jgi:hypothetical protein
MNAEVVQFPAPDVLDNVPVELRELRGWLLWKLVEWTPKAVSRVLAIIDARK